MNYQIQGLSIHAEVHGAAEPASLGPKPSAFDAPAEWPFRLVDSTEKT
jgi:hypothetical protein